MSVDTAGSKPLSNSKIPTETCSKSLGESKQVGISTLAVHAGEARQKPTNSITDPVVMASTFTFENTQSIIDFIENDQDRGEYGRYGVPGEKVVERKLAFLRYMLLSCLKRFLRLNELMQNFLVMSLRMRGCRKMAGCHLFATGRVFKCGMYKDLSILEQL